jgi:type VI secretion system protein ImpL
MRKILFSHWLLGFIGTAILAALLWVFGPFLALLQPWPPRAAGIAVLLAIWAATNLLIGWRRRARDKALAHGVTEPAANSLAPAGEEAASAEEAAALQERLGRAMALLRKARGTRGYLYQQPWYVIIGPPGAGKTTALLNAGLRFPLADEMGDDAIPGVGGTRLCDWWFTDDAVLIDTAGRYTTQDSDAAVDRAGWEHFLDLLKRTRTRQPLNGVIVAISLADIALGSAEAAMAHATSIRRRLNDLRDRLGVRLPVYAVLTKADLIAGFTEFFDDLDREQRAQVWGTTFPLTQPDTGAAPAFATAFRALVQRLQARLIDRMQAERSPGRRALIAGFPDQVASLGEPVQRFLEAAFGGSRLSPAPMLRGVYLTSGTQQGTPFDRLTGVLARGFGIDQRRAPSLRAEHGKSFFLNRLLCQVIRGEAMLVSERPGTARRRRAVLAAGYAALTLAVVGGGLALWSARSAGHLDIDRFSTAVAAYGKSAAQWSPDPVTDADLPAIVPILDQARALLSQAEGSGLGLGLSQQDKLQAASRLVYRNALQRILLPRLLVRLEGQMRAAQDKPDFLYEATRVYLMLGSQGPLDRDLIAAWMRLDWEQAWPGPGPAAMRADLLTHLNTLLAQPLPQVSLDGALVDAARVSFSRVPAAQRVYSRIALSAAAQTLPLWRPADPLGAAGAPLFLRSSGKPLTDGIPGFYTAAGFTGVLLPSVPEVAKQVAAESWVLGKQSEIDVSAPALQALQHDVVRLYEADTIQRWDTLLADLNLAPQSSIQQAAQALYLLGSPQSPMRGLLASVTRELTVMPPAAPAAPTSAATELQRLLVPAANAAAAQPGSATEAHFRPLRDYLGQGPGAPIDQSLIAINAVQQNLAQLVTAASGTVPAPAGGDPVLTLRAVALQAPQPVQRWLMSIAVAGTALRAGGTRQQLAAAFNGEAGPAALCEQTVQGHYPFYPKAGADIPLGDFNRLFAPNGLIDSYFNAQLRPYVDTAGPVWRPQAADGISPPISAGQLAQFQRASVIRQMFFSAGGAAPSVQLEITPVDLDPGARQVTMDLGATSIVYAHGPERATSFKWPDQGSSSARLVFDPAAPGGNLRASGPWALFRLIQQGSLRQDGAPNHYTLTFQSGERRAVFSIRADSVVNPLQQAALQDFRCPALH